MVQLYEVYVIELEGGKWYVYNHPDRFPIGACYKIACFYTHWKGVGTPPWIEKYRPLQTNLFPGEPHRCGALDDEGLDKFVWKLMKEKGIENVRGGSFQAIDLTKDDVRRLMRKYCNEPQDESEKTILKRMDERLERLEHKYLV
jgi:hypothetical protein